jgi:dTDP-4-dehydrorhamnose 3,5-epimerase
MKFIKTDIDGVIIVEPRIFPDSRGYFFESYNEQEFIKNGIPNRFVQDNESKSSYGVVRGLHCQLGEHSQAKLVRVISGTVLDVAVDVRKNSPTFGKYVAVELSDKNKRQLFIPRDFLHGFSVLSETAIFAYKVDNFYNKESEFGIRYDSPEINIDWRVPAEKIITSEKDRLAHTLADLRQLQK